MILKRNSSTEILGQKYVLTPLTLICAHFWPIIMTGMDVNSSNMMDEGCFVNFDNCGGHCGST